MTIDHTGFSHIVEKIADTDTATLIAFRRLSHYWRDWADAKLFQHVLIGRPVREMELHDQAAFKSNPHKEPPADRGFEMRLPYAPHKRLPCLPWDTEWSPSASDTPLANASRKRSLQNVRMVHYFGAITTPLQGHFPNLRVLRREWAKVVPSTRALTAPVTIDVLDFYYYQYPNGLGPRSTVGINIDPGVKKYTLYLKFYIFDPPRDIHLQAYGTPEIIEIVLKPMIYLRSGFDYSPQVHFLYSLLRSVRDFTGRGVKVSIVGLEMFHIGQFSVNCGFSTVLGAVKDLIGEVALTNVSFFKYDEWKAGGAYPLGEGKIPGSKYKQGGNEDIWYEIEEFDAPDFRPNGSRLPAGANRCTHGPGGVDIRDQLRRFGLQHTCDRVYYGRSE